MDVVDRSILKIDEYNSQIEAAQQMATNGH
jgi:hypothetical protein